MDPQFAIYILVVEDTNANAELFGLAAGTVESILDIESEEAAIRVAEAAKSAANEYVRVAINGGPATRPSA